MIRFLLLLLFAVAAQAAGPYRVTVVANADGTIRTAYPAGDFTPAATLAADCTAAPLLTPLETGASFSHNYRQFFSGTAAAAATLSVVSVSGDNPATYNWTISTDNLVNTGDSGNAGHSGVLKVRATNGASVADCANQSWAWVAPPTTDTTAPAPPTGFRSTGVGSGTVDLAWDACRDPYNNSAGTPGQGCAQYNIKLNGSVVATQAASVGLTSNFTLTNIGGVGSPAGTQTGNSWSLTGITGTGFGQGTADGMAFWHQQFTGDGHSIAYITAQSSESDYPKVGPAIRESLDANSASYGCYSQDSTVAQFRGRSATGGTAGTLGQASGLSLPMYLKLERVSNTLSCSYSLDGGSWIPITSTTITWSNPYWGFGASSTNVAVTTTATVDGVNVNNVAEVTKTVTEACTAPCLWTINVQDAQATPNASAYTTHTVSAVPEAPAGNAIKYNPGHYVWYTPSLYGTNDLPGRVTSLISFINSTICTESSIAGIMVYAYHSSLENDTAGVYNGTKVYGSTTISIGFDWVDPVLAAVQACGKHLQLALVDYTSGNTAPNAWGFPAYVYAGTETSQVVNLPGGGTRTDYRKGCLTYTASPGWSGGAGQTEVIWESQCMNNIINLTNAYGDRYNGNAYFEMFSPNVNMSYPSGNGGIYGFTNAAFATQTIRMMGETRPRWPNTQLHVWMDYFGTDAEHLSVLQAGIANDFTFGGNDVLPNEDIQGDRLFNGDGTGTDYRGVVPWVAAIAGPELCGKEGTFTPNQLFNHTMDGNVGAGRLPMRAQYIMWYRNDGSCNNDTTSPYYGVQRFTGAGSASTYLGNSTSSVAIGTGAKTFTVESGKSFSAGQYVMVVNDANNYMEGTVTSYSGTSLVINSLRVVGSGTKTSWAIRREHMLTFMRSLGGYISDGTEASDATPSTRLSPAAVKAACVTGFAGGCQ